MGEDDSKYASYFDGSSDNKDPPSDYDWLKARIFVKFLKIFYQVTLKFSGSLYVTSNIFFHEIVEIHANLSNLMSSGDMLLSRMAERMKLKFEKYWENYKNINFLLYIAVVLDPRFKLRYVQFCFSQLYDNRKCTEMIMYVETALNKLFANYEQEHSKEQGNFNHSDVQDKNVVGCENSTTMAAKFLEQMREDDQQDSKSDLYIIDDLEIIEELAGEFVCLNLDEDLDG
ncbi:zinc finger BED domain-containing protein RICESLEEPER 2-like [Heracleum sosnowskyi]|nr:zinc finger BED domain-containing protein RICESLEEPER 2-like [Heracleum sosnowskyi]